MCRHSMNIRHRTKQDRRERRRARVKARIWGTKERPRLNVFRSLRGIYAQCIDDETGRTVVGLQSVDVDAKIDAGERTGKTAEAYRQGRTLAEKAKSAHITRVVFDRAGYAYHGRVKALAEGARDGGLEF